MKIIPFYAKGWESNSYLVINNSEALLVDAGASEKAVLEALKGENAKLKYIILTHGHFDHTITAAALREISGARLAVHKDDEEMLYDAEKSALAAFLGRYDRVGVCDMLLENGEKVEIGGLQIEIIHTPGHSKGSVCLLCESSLFTGDTLFNGGYGRYDLYGGDFGKLCHSLSALKELDGELDIFPGHGSGAKLKTALNYLNFI